MYIINEYKKVMSKAEQFAAIESACLEIGKHAPKELYYGAEILRSSISTNYIIIFQDWTSVIVVRNEIRVANKKETDELISQSGMMANDILHGMNQDHSDPDYWRNSFIRIYALSYIERKMN